MALRPLVTLFAPATVLLVSLVTAAEDTGPEALLKGKGLRRSGTTYVLPGEAQLQKQLDAAKDRYKRLTFAQRQQTMFEQAAVNGKAMMRALTQQRMTLNRQIAQTTAPAARNELILMMNEVTDQLNLLSEESDDPEAKKKLVAQVAEQREGFMQAVLDARQGADETTAAYAKLADDAQVRDALQALNAKTKAKLALGPSRTFLSNLKLLERAEASVLSEDVALRDGNGVFLVDVTFNGKVTKEMILDTGASIVSITSAVAHELGLEPTAETPTIQVRIADGSIVEEKLMAIPSVRVGKFTVQNVPCAVAPPDRKDSPLLLGGSFLKHFVYHVKPDAAKLTLTKVDVPDDAPGAARGKAAGKSARRPAGKRAAKAAAGATPDDER